MQYKTSTVLPTTALKKKLDGEKHKNGGILYHLARDKSKGKAIPLQAWSGPEGSRKLRFPDFMTMAQDGGKVVSLTHRPHLPPFLLEAESTPGPWCNREDYVNEKFQWHHLESNQRPSDL